MPPATLRPDLSPEDIDRVNGIRTQMWTRGAQGFFFGGLTGWYGCRSLMKFQQRHPAHALAKASRVVGGSPAFVAGKKVWVCANAISPAKGTVATDPYVPRRLTSKPDTGLEILYVVQNFVAVGCCTCRRRLAVLDQVQLLTLYSPVAVFSILNFSKMRQHTLRVVGSSTSKYNSTTGILYF